MNLELPYELQGLRQLVRDFVTKELQPLEAELRDNDDLSPEHLERLKNLSLELGLYNLGVPEEYGGGGVGILGQTVVAEEMGKVAVGFRHLVGTPTGSRIIMKFGSEYLKEQYGRPLVRGEKRCAFCVSEPNAGSDLSGITTIATRDGDHYVINGMKHFMTDIDKVQLLALAVYTDKAAGFHKGLSFFVVPKNTPGLTIGRRQTMMGREGLHSYELFFDNMALPAANCLGAEGQGHQILMDQVHTFRLLIGALCLGSAERLTRLSAEYAQQRVQFKRPIAQFQGIQWMLAESEIDMYATRMLVYSTAWKLEQGVDAATETAMVKAYAPEMAWRAVDRALQIHGGMGYTRDLPIESVFRAIRLLRIVEGSAEINKGIIAGNLTKGSFPWN